MITSRKISQVNVFAGSPWEVASVKNLLKAAYIEVSMKENGRNGFLLSVPCEYYTAAMSVYFFSASLFLHRLYLATFHTEEGIVMIHSQ